MSASPSERARDLRILFATCSPAQAEGLARTLVEERLAACVNVVPGVRSFYRWEGAVQDDAELLLVAKTHAERGGALAARVKELHPYDLPEVLELPAVGGSDAYLDWVRSECSS